MRSNERCRISTLTVAHPQRTLGRLLNSCRDFDAAIDFLGRARIHDRAARDAMLLGALISYSHPFKDRDHPLLGRPLNQLPVFLDAAADLGVNLELHVRLLQLRAHAVGSSPPLTAPLRPSASSSNAGTHRFSFASPLGHCLAQQLERQAFERIAHLMRLACVFTLKQIAHPET